jgi:hypothetical protein
MSASRPASAFQAPAYVPMLSDDARREFRRQGDAYVLRLPDLGIAFHVDRVRRDRHELVGELAVECGMAGARTVGGSLSVADFNLSSLTARVQRGLHLRERSRAEDVDWQGLLEELCQRVIAEERTGVAAVSLRDVPRPEADSGREVLGVPLLLRHPLILFGDGGSAKSYLALYMAGELARSGVRVGMLDWELDGGDHRVRLEAIYGGGRPTVHAGRARYRRRESPRRAHLESGGRRPEAVRLGLLAQRREGDVVREAGGRRPRIRTAAPGPAQPQGEPLRQGGAARRPRHV